MKAYMSIDIGRSKANEALKRLHKTGATIYLGGEKWRVTGYEKALDGTPLITFTRVEQ